jgi:hypothetical protein
MFAMPSKDYLLNDPLLPSHTVMFTFFVSGSCFFACIFPQMVASAASPKKEYPGDIGMHIVIARVKVTTLRVILRKAAVMPISIDGPTPIKNSDAIPNVRGPKRQAVVVTTKIAALPAGCLRNFCAPVLIRVVKGALVGAVAATLIYMSFLIFWSLDKLMLLPLYIAAGMEKFHFFRF